MKRLIFLLIISFFIPVLCLGVGVDINTASLSELDKLDGIGPSKARAIIDARPFLSVDDLDKVKGIGSATLQKIKTQGLACVNCQSQQNTPLLDTQETSNTSTTQNEFESTPLMVNAKEIFLNEILPSPKGADDTDEWIEIYNANSSDVDLSGWQLQDTQGSIITFIFPQNTKILAGGYLIFTRPTTKIMLNNDSDGLNLLSPDKKVIDSLFYTKALTGQSYNKTNSGWVFSTTITPGSINIISRPSSSVLSKAKKSVNNDIENQSLASLSQSINLNQENKRQNPWFLFFTVLIITIVLAIIVIFIKIRVYKNKRETQH